jgi:hypothetical protein
MKKILFVIAIVCSSLTINAQTDESYKADTAKLVEIISADAFQPFIAQILTTIPEESQTAFSEELTATFPGLYAAMAEIYMEEFTHEEIKELISFYETPIGKKIASKSGELSQKGMSIGQEWGVEVQEIMLKYQ